MTPLEIMRRDRHQAVRALMVLREQHGDDGSLEAALLAYLDDRLDEHCAGDDRRCIYCRNWFPCNAVHDAELLLERFQNEQT